MSGFWHRVRNRTGLMRVALPIWDGRLSPVLDVARQILLVDLPPASSPARETRVLETTDPAERVQTLIAWGAQVVICGAVSRELEQLLIGRGVRVIARVRGPVEEVLRAYLAHRLDQPRFAMPGCGRRQRTCRRKTRKED
ncbi:MAG: NifB/NifX family molybdenum-iron cluster-binding protein [Phycisphaeraceae bacterium]